MGTEGSGASRAGGEGIHNEDAFLVEEGLGLYVVCDGASSRPAGEVAARIAAEALEELVGLSDEDFDLADPQVARSVVETAMRYALRAVTEAEEAEPGREGLATTVTMLLARGDLGVFGHTGDSRAYLYRRGRVHQLTVDHEWTSASNGSSQGSGFDVFGLDLQPGDTLVLCTDGAEAVVGDPAIVRHAGDVSPRLLASRIVAAAHQRSPDQDATAIAVRVRGDRRIAALELSGEPRGTRFGHTLERT
jgi:protein phosphatase